MIMNQKGMDRLLSNKFTIGADASAAAGPVGRHAGCGNGLEAGDSEETSPRIEQELYGSWRNQDGHHKDSTPK